MMTKIIKPNECPICNKKRIIYEEVPITKVIHMREHNNRKVYI